MAERFASQIVVMTGGGGGLARPLAGAFLEEGATVVLLDLHQQPLEEARAALSGSGPVAIQQTDVTSQEQVHHAFELIAKRHGEPRVLLNLAGGTFDVPAEMSDVSSEQVDQVLDTNVKGITKSSRS